jgi:hypothetical protein
MFFWGSGHKSARQKAAGPVICQSCGQGQDLSVQAEYDYSHIYWLFKSVKNVKASLVCGSCGHVQPATDEKPSQFFERYGGNPIPRLDRHGGMLLVLLIAGFVGYGYLTEAGRDATGTIQSSGQVDAFSLRVGDCFNEPGDPGSDGSEVSSVPALPCSEPHDAEVFAVFNVELTAYPADDELNDFALDGCIERFGPFVGLDYASSAFDVYTLTPTHESWHSQGDREVVCALYDMENEKLQGSMRESRL